MEDILKARSQMLSKTMFKAAGLAAIATSNRKTFASSQDDPKTNANANANANPIASTTRNTTMSQKTLTQVTSLSSSAGNVNSQCTSLTALILLLL